jgi:hypothetical protein
MTTIHISLTTPVAIGVKSAATGGGSRNEIEALQKKMTDLINQLKEAAHDRSPGAKERLKLLQLAIQACQMQIDQLMSTAAQKAAKKAKESAESDAASDSKHTTSALGAQVDTHA